LLSVTWANDADREQANDIKDTTSWQKPRSLENLPEFLETFAEDAKKLGEAPKAKGEPHTLIVASAGLRAADLVRYVHQVEPLAAPQTNCF
jgi:protein CMS1